MRVVQPTSRAVLLALACLVTAFAAATAAFLGLLLLGLPPTDVAYGMSVWELWADPFVRLVAFPIALAGAALGYLGARRLLWRTDLSKSAPLVFTVTVLVAFVAGRVIVLGALGTLLCAVVAMKWCQKRFAMELHA